MNTTTNIHEVKSIEIESDNSKKWKDIIIKDNEGNVVTITLWAYQNGEEDLAITV